MRFACWACVIRTKTEGYISRMCNRTFTMVISVYVRGSLNYLVSTDSRIARVCGLPCQLCASGLCAFLPDQFANIGIEIVKQTVIIALLLSIRSYAHIAQIWHTIILITAELAALRTHPVLTL
jgi:hypothetical protein